MITTADWFRYIDSLGPADAQSMRSRLQSAGADPEHADWLVSLVWKRQVARYVARIAFLVLLAGLGWSAYFWWLAFMGSPRGPEIRDLFFPAGVIMIGAVALLISSAVEISPPLDLMIAPKAAAQLSPPPRQYAFSEARAGAGWRLGLAAIAMMMGPLLFSATEVRDLFWLRLMGLMGGPAIGLLTAAAIGVFVLIIARFASGTQKVLAERGVATTAEITDSAGQGIRYRFGENTGRFFWGKRRVRVRPAVGESIAILYDAEKPKRSIPLGALSDVEFN